MRLLITLLLSLALGVVATPVDADAQSISWPFGQADTSTVAFGDTLDISIDNGLTYVLSDTLLTSDVVVNITTPSDIKPGAFLFIQASSDGTARDLNAGTGVTSASITGTISKTKVAAFLYTGTTWLHISTQQVD